MALPIITAIGNLKRIESKFIPSGKKIVSFQLECSEKNSKGEWENLYIKGEVWEKSADFVEQYFKEGSVAIVTGKLVTNVYEKQDGSKVYENKFMFPNVTFPPKDKTESNNGQTNNNSNNGGQQQYNTPQQQAQQQNYNAPQQQYQAPQNNIPTIDIDNDEVPF